MSPTSIYLLHLLKTGALTSEEESFLHYFERAREQKMTDWARFRRIVGKYFKHISPDLPPIPLPDFDSLPF